MCTFGKYFYLIFLVLLLLLFFRWKKKSQTTVCIRTLHSVYTKGTLHDECKNKKNWTKWATNRREHQKNCARYGSQHVMRFLLFCLLTKDWVPHFQCPFFSLFVCYTHNNGIISELSNLIHQIKRPFRVCGFWCIEKIILNFHRCRKLF